jgi:hypothetical protein
MAMAARSVELISEKSLVNDSNRRSAVRCDVMGRPCLLTRCTKQISLRQLHSSWIDPDRAGELDSSQDAVSKFGTDENAGRKISRTSRSFN